MNKTLGACCLSAALLAGVLLPPAALAQWQASESGPRQTVFSQQELDQMLAPIALYPDALLTQILMAATYPLEVVEAARWSRARPGLRGEQAVNAAANEDWDPSVKSLLAFPEILALMDERLDWTKRLGDAFLDQEPHVMDTIQGLRHRAQTAGSLQSGEQMRVAQQGQVIQIAAVQPDVMFVPWYDPALVYGAWWWPSPPQRWAAWPGYQRRPGVNATFFWSSAYFVTPRVLFGSIDWPRRSIVVSRVQSSAPRSAASWTHDQGHRRDLPYRQTGYRDATSTRHSASPIINPHAGLQRTQVAQYPQQQRRDDRPIPGATIKALPTAPALPTTPQVQPRAEHRDQERRRGDEERRSSSRDSRDKGAE